MVNQSLEELLRSTIDSRKENRQETTDPDIVTEEANKTTQPGSTVGSTQQGSVTIASNVEFKSSGEVPDGTCPGSPDVPHASKTTAITGNDTDGKYTSDAASNDNIDESFALDMINFWAKYVEETKDAENKASGVKIGDFWKGVLKSERARQDGRTDNNGKDDTCKED